MSQFTYARKDGTQGTIEAPDANAALRMMPKDADPHSGVQASLSGTGTPSPSGTPASLPDAKSSPLLSFADSLNQAVNLAKSHRNESTVGIMKPFQGTVAASDFNSIIGNLNKASDTTSSDLIKKVSDITKSDIVTTTSDNGDVHGIDKNTGKILWTAKGVGNKQKSGEDVTKPLDVLDIGRYNDLYPDAGVVAGDTKAIADAKALKSTSPEVVSKKLVTSYKDAHPDSTYEDAVTEINNSKTITDKASAITAAKDIYGTPKPKQPSFVDQIGNFLFGGK